MHPRIPETLSLLRNLPPGRVRSRVTLTAAAASAGAAALAAAMVASGPVAGPAAAAARHVVTAGAAGHFRGVSPVVAVAVSGPHVRNPASAGTAHSGPPGRPAQRGGDTHLAARVRPQGRGQPRRAAATQARAARNAPARPARPYRIYDSVNPSAIPAGEAAAVYADGRYCTRPAQVHSLGHALWVDVTGHNYAASVLDVEPGDATPSQAASWAWHRLRAHHHAPVRIYTFRRAWPAVKASIATLPSWMRARVHWWIADPTGVPHMVRGAHATQWYWGTEYDKSLASPGF